MDNKEIKQKVRDDMINTFNELYCGAELPTIDRKKVDFFVRKALNMFESELFYSKQFPQPTVCVYGCGKFKDLMKHYKNKHKINLRGKIQWK